MHKTRVSARKAGKAHNAIRVVGGGGGTRLETTEQQRNYAQTLVGNIISGVAQDQVRRVIADRTQKLYAKDMEAHCADRREWLGYLVDGKVKLPDSVEGMARYQQLTTRYGVPNEADVHIDMLATDYLADLPQGEFIAPLALPFWRVASRTGKIQLLDRRQGKNASFDDSRPPGTAAKQISFALGSRVSYDVDGRGLSVPIPDEVVAQEQDPIKVAQLGARYVREIVMLKHEKRVQTILQTSTNFPSANRIATPTVKWDNVDTSDMEHKDDIDLAQRLIQIACGRRPNTAIMTLQVAQALIRKDDFVRRLQYVEKTFDDTLMQAIGAYLGVDNVLIPTCMEDTADLSGAASYSNVWDDDVVLLVVDPPGIGSVGFGVCPATDLGTAMSWRDPNPTTRTDWTALLFDVDEVIVTSEAGAHLADVLTTVNP